jgi:hypothetical protein
MFGDGRDLLPDGRPRGVPADLSRRMVGLAGRVLFAILLAEACSDDTLSVPVSAGLAALANHG